MSLYKQIASLLVPYAIMVSSLYLFGFWGEFGINVLEYIGVGEIVKYSIYHLSQSAGLLLVFMLSFQLLLLEPYYKFFVVPLHKEIDSGNITNPRPDKLLQIAHSLFLVFCAISMLYMLFFENVPQKWLAVAIFATPLVVHKIMDPKFLPNFLPTRILRMYVAVPSVMILLCAYGWGATNAFSLKDDAPNMKIDGANENLKYVGKVGVHFVGWDNERKLITIVSESSIDILSIKSDTKRQSLYESIFVGDAENE